MIIYEMLPLSEWETLKPLYEKCFPGGPFPSPEVSCAAVAKDGDKVIAFWFLQMCAHAEPVGIDPEYSGLVSLHKLQDTVHEAFSDRPGMEYYVNITDDHLDEVLQKNGFRFIGRLYAANVPQTPKATTVPKV